MDTRKKVFGKDYAKKAVDLLEEHKKAFPSVRFALGYPGEWETSTPGLRHKE
jgi:hypothetical protein